MPERLGERFDIMRVLGEGSSGTVYQAYDRETRSLVALKTMRAMGPGAIQRIKQEARQLALFAHRNLVSFYELVAEQGDWLLSMEYVAGVPFHEAVGAAPGGPLTMLHALLPQLVAGVSALHAQGRVHRDLKPANVLVQADGRLVILDFGLVRATLSVDTDLGFCGTPAYAAPEQLLGQTTGPHSDWYAVGVMLFEALTGQLPYVGQRSELLERKQAPPAWPTAVGEPVCSQLQEACLGLLHPDPAHRLDGEALLRALHGFTPSSLPRAHPSGTRPLVDRPPELRVLEQGLDAACADKAQAWLVHGASGTGKTTLLSQLAQLAAERGFLVLHSRCQAHERLPYQAVDAVVDGMVSALRQLPLASTAGMLSPEAHALARVFPALKQLAALREVPRTHRSAQTQGEPASELLGCALASLLQALASRAPILVWIDDAHESATDDAALLGALVQHLGGRVMVVLSAHSSGLPALRHLAEQELKLAAPPLRAVDQVAGELPAEPLSALASAAHHVLALICLSRRPVARSLLLACAQDATLTHLHSLLVHKLVRPVRTSDDGIAYEPYEQHVVQRVADTLSAQQCALLHGQLADGYLAAPQLQATCAIEHLLEAGRFTDAASLVGQAATQARDAQALARAAELVQATLAHAPEGATHPRLQRTAGEVFSAAARFHEAAQSYGRALPHATPDEHFELQCRTMESLFLAGEQQQACAMRNRLAASVGLRFAYRRLGQWFMALLLTLRYLLFGAPRLARAAAPGSQRHKRAQLAWSATAVQHSDLVLWGYSCLLALRETARAGMTDEYQVLRVAWAAGLASLGLTRARDAHVVAQAERAQAPSSRADWLWNACGVYHFYTGSVGRAVDAFEQALSHASIAGRSSGLRFARNALLVCWYWQGAMSRVREHAQDWALEAQRAGDVQLSPLMSMVAAFSQLDMNAQLAARQMQALQANPNSAVQNDLWWQIWCQLHQGQLERAYRIARRLPLCGRLDLPEPNYVVGLMVRGQVAAATLAAHPERCKELKLIRRKLRRYRQPASRAFAALLEATQHAARGRPVPAYEELLRAQSRFEALGMHGYAAAAAARRGELLGGTAGRALVEEGRAQLRALGFLEPAAWLSALTPGFQGAERAERTPSALDATHSAPRSPARRADSAAAAGGSARPGGGALRDASP